jgi:hypothetical protein
MLHPVGRTLIGIPTMEHTSQIVSPHTLCPLIFTHKVLVWVHKDFQDRAVWLWEALAKHYKGNKWIAGYNPLNEPTDALHTRVLAFYDRVHKAIRAIDPDHIIFFDGNTQALRPTFRTSVMPTRTGATLHILSMSTPCMVFLPPKSHT